MKILLLGKNGQLGWQLQRSLALLGEVVALERDAQANPHGLAGDLAAPEALRATVRQLRPDVIVNAAAYTAVDKAETEREAAFTVNAAAPEVLAQEAQALGAWLVHYSTDYVFDGRGSAPWREGDTAAPLSVYGLSKFEGEQRIAQACARHLIFRTSWVYGAHGQNFLKTMLRLGTQRPELSVVNDQIGAPTGAALLADATAHAIRSLPGSAPESVAGLYHLSASGEASWWDFACFVLAQAQALQPDLAVARVNPIPTQAYPTPAQRPLNSRLDTQKFQRQFGLCLPHWQDGVRRVVQQLKSS